MSSLPLPIRLAAGLAAIALERARKLPQDVTEWPMTAVSQALQLSMRVQQRITELAIKGDEALAGLREPQEDPPWAVFDEDLPRPSYLRPDTAPPATDGATEAAIDDVTGAAGEAAFDDELDAYDLGEDTTAEERTWFEAIDEAYAQDPEEPNGQARAMTVEDEYAEPGGDIEVQAAGLDATSAATAQSVPTALPSYPTLTLASVRGRLRVLSLADLEELLDYERSHQDRPEFVRMLTNRIATVRAT